MFTAAVDTVDDALVSLAVVDGLAQVVEVPGRSESARQRGWQQRRVAAGEAWCDGQQRRAAAGSDAGAGAAHHTAREPSKLPVARFLSSSGDAPKVPHLNPAAFSACKGWG